jgi:hypothetical protein
MLGRDGNWKLVVGHSSKIERTVNSISDADNERIERLT